LISTNGTGAIVGDIDQTGWSAPSPLWADLAPTWTGKSHSPWAGAYTVSLPWDTTTSAGGTSYANVKVSGSGVLSAVGGLADGSTFNQTVALSNEGSWPFFAVSSANDVILGWVSFASNGPASTNLLWILGKESSESGQVQLRSQ
jgi:hypothetical protein